MMAIDTKRPTDEQIAACVARLAEDRFDPDADWAVCFAIVQQEVLSRRLYSRDYAPSSRFGGSEWNKDDFSELTADWIIHVRGARASRIARAGRSASHIANSARLSAYHFVLGQLRRSPQSDLRASLVDAVSEFPELLQPGYAEDLGAVPVDPFPFIRRDPSQSARHRSVSTSEVRDALEILSDKYPRGWDLRTLYRVLAEWSGVGGDFEISLEGSGLPESAARDTERGGPDSELIGRDAARAVLAVLDDQERQILCRYILPNAVGEATLEQAAGELGVSKSTLYDRAKRLVDHLGTLRSEGIFSLDPAAKKAFIGEIMKKSSGKDPGDQSKE